MSTLDFLYASKHSEQDLVERWEFPTGPAKKKGPPGSMLRACIRCRDRKLRCDTTLPRCGPCEARNSLCEIYDPTEKRVVKRNLVTRRQQTLDTDAALPRVPADSSGASLTRAGLHGGTMIATQASGDAQAQTLTKKLALRLADVCHRVLIRLITQTSSSSDATHVQEGLKSPRRAIKDGLNGRLEDSEHAAEVMIVNSVQDRARRLQRSANTLQIWWHDAQQANSPLGGLHHAPWSLVARRLIDMSNLLITATDKACSQRPHYELARLSEQLQDLCKDAANIAVRDFDSDTSDDECEAVYDITAVDLFEESLEDVLQDLVDLSPAIMTAPSTTGAQCPLDDDTLLRPLPGYMPILSEEDDFLLQLKEHENLTWEDIVSRFRHDRGEVIHLTALMMRYKRLRERYPESEHQNAPSARGAPHYTGVSLVEGNDPSVLRRDGRLPTLPDASEASPCPVVGCERKVKDLTSHMLTHQTQRPEKCPIPTCEYHRKGFATKYDKLRHTLTHYKGTMRCGFCSTDRIEPEGNFNRVDGFKRHLVHAHQVEQAPPNTRSYKDARKAVTKGAGMLDSERSAKGSVCEATFVNPQIFYEHLDECVLHAIQDANRLEDESRPTRSGKNLDMDATRAILDIDFSIADVLPSDNIFGSTDDSYSLDNRDTMKRKDFNMSRNVPSPPMDSGYCGGPSVVLLEILEIGP
ncbi:hypothetical protein LTR95_016075 [Oleoguttula sp. CCFEE 5521]